MLAFELGPSLAALAVGGIHFGDVLCDEGLDQFGGEEPVLQPGQNPIEQAFTHNRTGIGAPMENLAHSAPFHSREKTAPLKPGIKNLASGGVCINRIGKVRSTEAVAD